MNIVPPQSIDLPTPWALQKQYDVKQLYQENKMLSKFSSKTITTDGQ